MFPHLRERIVLTDRTGRKRRVADNVAVLNGMDLSPVVESTDVREIGYVVDGEIGNSNRVRSDGITLKVAELSSLTRITVIGRGDKLTSRFPGHRLLFAIQRMIDSGEPETSINGVVIKNGLIATDVKTANGEILMRGIVVTTRQQYDLPEDAVVYCCFNQLYKLDPRTFRMWLDVRRFRSNRSARSFVLFEICSFRS